MEISNNIHNLNLNLKVNSVENNKPIDFANKIDSNNKNINQYSSKHELTPGELQKMAEDINDLATKLEVGISFTQDEKTGQSIIQFVDSSTNEVIKQIPSEEMLKIVENIHKFLEKNYKQFPSGKILNEVA